jgi:hypothetical protein
VGARALVLIGVVAASMTRVVPVVGLLPPIIPFAPVGVQDDTSVSDGADTLPYRGQVGSPHATWRLVDGRVPGVLLGGRMLAGVGPAPS